ncbi:MAG TPA: UDP-glucose/GDP-mannose dehydrogenase family protein [Sedimentisphaerales bacterium]|nr:UDP-glucose/GDP-mannose dehydrogenase family protein [Sedimentisphaerales bacterium]HRS10290.1 UDP-glucose/GDP-mannose dehydrogenase family protein [Sedimentisphaerales bacterium]HRV46995.1 UDP-glucose/GDP-mannose dehydrogenase family protein [Sedimentisphaerales bacterium]
MKVGVVGVGYVGLVTAACLADSGTDVICVDSNEEKIQNLRQGIIPIYEPGLTEIVNRTRTTGRLQFTTSLKEAVEKSLLLFIAVGTPSGPDGSADLSAVFAVAEGIAEHMDGYRILVVKSTVPVGTHVRISERVAARTRQPFDYVSNPEFLKEGSAIDDFMKPERIIIGARDAKVREIMRHLYAPFMRRKERIIFMDPASAELTKYAANCMLATRISFMNELSALCEAVGADIELVRAGIGSDARIGNAFLFAGAGFGGSCFPKDIRALIHTGQEVGVPMSIIQAVQQVNAEQQRRFARKVLDYYAGREDRTTLAVWGLAFKARTDDIRESPAIFCVEEFRKAGMQVRAHDPEAMGPARQVLGETVTFCPDHYEALEGAEGLVVLTDWQQFRNPDFEFVARKLSHPVIFDGRNLYDPAYVRSAGIEYHGVGRPNA